MQSQHEPKPFRHRYEKYGLEPEKSPGWDNWFFGACIGAIGGFFVTGLAAGAKFAWKETVGKSKSVPSTIAQFGVLVVIGGFCIAGGMLRGFFEGLIRGGLGRTKGAMLYHDILWDEGFNFDKAREGCLAYEAARDAAMATIAEQKKMKVTKAKGSGKNDFAVKDEELTGIEEAKTVVLQPYVSPGDEHAAQRRPSVSRRRSSSSSGLGMHGDSPAPMSAAAAAASALPMDEDDDQESFMARRDSLDDVSFIEARDASAPAPSDSVGHRHVIEPIRASVRIDEKKIHEIERVLASLPPFEEKKREKSDAGAPVSQQSQPVVLQQMDWRATEQRGGYWNVSTPDKAHSFEIYSHKLTTKNNEVNTFIAMLKSFKVLHPEANKIPKITPARNALEIWKKAIDVVYEDSLGADKESFYKTIFNPNSYPVRAAQTDTHVEEKGPSPSGGMSR